MRALHIRVGTGRFLVQAHTHTDNTTGTLRVDRDENDKGRLNAGWLLLLSKCPTMQRKSADIGGGAFTWNPEALGTLHINKGEVIAKVLDLLQRPEDKIELCV